ncbi:MAG: PTS sugar transporter subunit IIA [Candidatus Zophobacter franzmannii]|nr:PTS sugar transporter subunit IIA [Candidatus Zophobacter franzmannii]
MVKKLLTVREAAIFLKLSEKIVQEMLADSIFETEKKGKDLRIVRDSIEEWLSNLSESEEEQLALKKTICRFGEYFNVNYIFMDLEPDNKYEAIRMMSEKAKSLKLVKDARWLYEVVVAREELVSTAVGDSVALLHPRHLHPSKIKSPSILLGRSSKGVEFDAQDGKPVNIFFMLLLHNDKQHLFSLSYLSKMMMNNDNLKKINESETSDEIFRILTNVDYK